MEWSLEITDGLTNALGTSTLLGLEADLSASEITLTLQIFTLADGADFPDDSVFFLTLSPVGRIAASLQQFAWGDATNTVVPLSVERLGEAVQSLQDCDCYGWEGFDGGDENLQRRADRLSLDWRGDTGDACPHTLGWFQQK